MGEKREYVVPNVSRKQPFLCTASAILIEQVKWTLKLNVKSA